MQLIPSLVLQHLQNPERVEKLFIQYILEADLTISASKTIAGVAYFDKKAIVTGTTSLSFFKENFNNTLTNIPGGSFIRPESEHLLIWAIRWESVTVLAGIEPTVAPYEPGLGGNTWLINSEFTVTTNSDVKIKQYPLSEALSDLTVRDNGVIPLAEPIFWAGQTEFEILLKNSGDIAAVAAEQGAIKPTLIGLGLI
jgi:hypothetical protein